MDSRLRDSLLSVSRLLSKYNVKYLVIGGTAVALHGYFRLSITAAGTPAEKPDLDFWYSPTYPNYFNLLKVIEELGGDVTKFIDERSPNPHKSYFKLEFDKFTIDFLPAVPGLDKFQVVYENRERITMEGVELSFIGLDD